MNSNTNQEQQANKTLLITIGFIIAAVLIIAACGFLFMNRPDNYIEGQVEGTTVRISGKLPGRIAEFYVEEGDSVKAGDTLVCIHSSIVEAQLSEAVAMQDMARAQNRKVDAGTRQQIIQAAADLVNQAEAAVTIAQKTYERIENLYNQGVVSEQKRDEARAAYDAAKAALATAQSNLSLARAGAQDEDKQSAAAMVQAADGAVAKVQALLDDSYLLAPFDGTIDEIYPEVGELVAMGTPIMSLLLNDNRWITFNVREELLNDFTMGKRLNVMIPALGCKIIETEIYYIRDRGNYAVWHATKTTGSWDSRTFEIKARPIENVAGLRPGMSAVYEK